MSIGSFDADLPGRQLAQVRPPNTTAASVYSLPDSDTLCVITVIFVANTTGVAATCRICHDEDGTTYNETTALVWDRAIAANTVFTISGNAQNGAGIWMRNSTGNLSVRTDTANALTFTVYGIESTR